MDVGNALDAVTVEQHFGDPAAAITTTTATTTTPTPSTPLLTTTAFSFFSCWAPYGCR